MFYSCNNWTITYNVHNYGKVLKDIADLPIVSPVRSSSDQLFNGSALLPCNVRKSFIVLFVQTELSCNTNYGYDLSFN